MFKRFIVPFTLTSQYLSGDSFDSRTDFKPAKWITASIESQESLRSLKILSNKFWSRISPLINWIWEDISFSLILDNLEIFFITFSELFTKESKIISRKPLLRSARAV